MSGIHPTRGRRWRRQAREEGRQEGERNALVELAGNPFGGVTGERLRALEARPRHEMVTEACNPILACGSSEQFISSFGGPHGFDRQKLNETGDLILKAEGLAA